MAKFAPLAIVFAIIVGAGTYIHAIASDRLAPQNSEALQSFTECIPNIPSVIGDWEGTDDTISDKEFKLTNCTAHVSRRYVNKKTGSLVSVYAVSGTGRHITIHSPDWCYQGAGYKMDESPKQYSMDCGNGLNPEFLTAVFRKPDPSGNGSEQVLRIFWTYSVDGQWVGPKWAKAHYAGVGALYKIYLICPADPSDPTAESSSGNQFAKDTLAEFNAAMFANSPAVE